MLLGWLLVLLYNVCVVCWVVLVCLGLLCFSCGWVSYVVFRFGRVALGSLGVLWVYL